MARALITMPKTARHGEIIEVRTLIAHPMETGYRPGENGAILPRNLIRRLTCRYADGAGEAVVFSAELYPAIAANPFISFSRSLPPAACCASMWEGDNGLRADREREPDRHMRPAWRRCCCWARSRQRPRQAPTRAARASIS